MKITVGDIYQKFDGSSMWNALRDSDGFEIFDYFVSKKKRCRILEIGTCRGVTTAILSQYADIVYTIDCVDFPMKRDIWKHYEIKNIQDFVFSPNNDAKVKIVNGLDFDFAFIDGGHGDDVILDYEITKRCGHVLFHDYTPAFPSIFKLVNTLDNVESRKEFAYWEKK